MNDSGECLFCDEKNLEWRKEGFVRLILSAKAMRKFNNMKVDRGVGFYEYERPYKDGKIHDCKGRWECERCGEAGMYKFPMSDGEIWNYKVEKQEDGLIGKLHDCRWEKIVCSHCGEVYKFDKDSTDINDGICDECKDCKSPDEFEERGKMNPDEAQMEPPSHYDPCEHCGSIDHPSEGCPFSGDEDETSDESW